MITIAISPGLCGIIFRWATTPLISQGNGCPNHFCLVVLGNHTTANFEHCITWLHPFCFCSSSVKLLQRPIIVKKNQEMAHCSASCLYSVGLLQTKYKEQTRKGTLLVDAEYIFHFYLNLHSVVQYRCLPAESQIGYVHGILSKVVLQQ